MLASSPSRSVRVWCLATLIASCLMVGCNPSSRTGTISGTVLLDGEPITSGRVMAANAKGKTGSGIIQSDGSYELKRRSGEGLEPGEYDLWVFALEQGDSTDPESAGESAVPQKYATQNTAGFSATVIAGETVDYDLELKTN